MKVHTPQEIVRALIEQGFTQAEIAAAAKTTQPTISRIARGDHTDPRASLADRLRRLAEINGLERQINPISEPQGASVA